MVGVGRKLAAILVAWAWASGAAAQTAVRCDLAPDTALNLAIAGANPGAILAITGLCKGNAAIASVLQSGLILTNHTGNPLQPLDANDGIAGQLKIAGPLQVAIDGIVLEGPATDDGSASVLLARGSTVTISNAQIVNGWRNGLVVAAKGSAAIANTTITGHGTANVPGEADGIRVMQGSALMLGAMGSDGSVDANAAVTVTNNAGSGIAAFGTSSVTVAGGTIDGNGASQVFVADGSEASLVGTQVTQTAASALPNDFAVQAMQSSRVMLMQGASVVGGTVAGGVLALSSSSLTIMGSTVANDTAGVPAIEASGSSNVLVTGGNSVTNTASGGTAIEIDHSSSLMQTASAPLSPEFAGVPAVTAIAADTISGLGLVQEQSSIDLGIGLIAGANSLLWNGSIAVAQNSSFRLSGGVAISGSVTLGQGSNGFFNSKAGGTNTVTGGLTCPWNAVPSAHVTGGSLNPAPPVAADFQSATRNQCLPF